MPPKLMSDSKAWNRRSFFGKFPTGAFLDERVKLAWDCVATDGAGKTFDQSHETPLPHLVRGQRLSISRT